MDSKQPVTRQELIDAIAKLHVINDSSSPETPIQQPIRNNSEPSRNKVTESKKQKRKRLYQLGRTSCSIKLRRP